jgi:hypothetical protein
MTLLFIVELKRQALSEKCAKNRLQPTARVAKSGAKDENSKGMRELAEK